MNLRFPRRRGLVAMAVGVAALATVGWLPARAQASVTAAAAPVTARTAPKCSIGVVSSILAESSAADSRRTTGWTLLRANGWTVFVPSGSWHLSASDAGADIGSPDGRSDASLAAWYSLSPWTFASLGNKILGGVSHIRDICKTPVESSSSGSTQATEFTGTYEGRSIHAVIVLSLLTPTTETFVGETRSLYTPVTQWSTSYETTLALILKRAILSPQSPG